MALKYIILILFSVVIRNVTCANILYIGAVASPSHFIWNQALTMGLVNKGHNLTFLTPDKDKFSSSQNYTSILLEGFYEQVGQDFDINEMATFGTHQMVKAYQEYCLYHCQILVASQGLQTLLNYPADFKFDLILIDITFGNCFYPLIQRFNFPPTVAVTAFLLPIYVSNNFGNHLHPSYIPFYALPYTDKMNFWERVANFFFTNLDIALRHNYEYKEQDKISHAVFGDDIKPWNEIERHISLVLANNDPILDYPQPVTPNIIPVGGLHTRKSRNLPEDLKKIVDNAKDGVILFSLGTNVRSDKLKESQQRALLDAFSKVRQTVIWKFESDIKNLPKNVIVRKWLPQNDILGHPNVKLFIGHGGALSTQEAIFHGVPMIAIPFIVDQHINTKMILKKKLGLTIDSTRITSDYVLAQLKEVLHNPIYNDNMKKASRRFRDRPETPLERGVFWVEYVLRHGGADFLNTSARDMPFYVSSGADVVVFLVLVLLTTVYIICKVIKLLLSCFKTGPKKKIKLN